MMPSNSNPLNHHMVWAEGGGAATTTSGKGNVGLLSATGSAGAGGCGSGADGGEL